MYSQLTDFSTLPIKKLNDPPEKVSHEEFKRRLKEIVKCKSDIVYFAEHYFHVVTSMVDESGAEKGTRTELIKLYAKQKDLLRAMVDNKRLITLAARQSGKTTTYTIFCLWLTLFHPEKKVLLCANQLATAIQVMDRIRLAYEDLPYFLKAPVLVYNKAEMTFCNQSSIRAFSTSSSSARGFTCVDGKTMVTVVDDNGGIYHTFIENVEQIADSSKIVISNMMEESAMKKYNFVYKTVNLVNGKEYIGVHATNNLDDGYLGSGKLLKQAVEKYGPDNFKRIIIQMFDTLAEAFELEGKLVDKEYVLRRDTYNVNLGGNVSPCLYGENNGFYGKRHSDETKDKMKLGWKKFYENHDSPLLGHNFLESDDVIVNGVRYTSFFNMIRCLHIGKLKGIRLLLEVGNGFVDEKRQQMLVDEYETYLKDREIRHQIHVENIRIACRNPERCRKISEAMKGREVPWIDKINKNPEKIRKTAEKHRGMKRSPEARKNMSDAVKKYYENGGVSGNAGKIMITNVETKKRRYISPNEVIPEGWVASASSNRKRI